MVHPPLHHLFAGFAVVGLAHLYAGDPPGMRWVPGGQFTMGTDDTRSMASERPAHKVTVSGFWMDEHPVTNAEFAAFINATGYVTIAQRPVDWEELNRDSHIGKLDKALDEAASRGWTVVDMKSDWNAIFVPEEKK